MSAHETDRKVANVVLFGTVAELDEASARVRVDADGMQTAWIPWASRRCGPGVREWTAPEVGEQVVVVCPSGDPAQGVVIGSIPQSSFDVPANVKTKHRTEYADGAFVEYDRESHAMTCDVPSGGSITLHVAGTTLVLKDGEATLTTNQFTVDAPTSTFKGDVNVENGTVTVTGGDCIADGISLKTHTHSAVTSGSSTSGPPV